MLKKILLITVTLVFATVGCATTAPVTFEASKGKILGIVTDGDLRRMLLTKKSIEGIKAKDIMNTDPKFSDKETMAVDALNLMKQHNISQLLITEKGKYLGMIHLHDLIREGII